MSVHFEKTTRTKTKNPLSSKQNKNNDISDFHYFAYSFLRFSWKSSGVKGNGFSELSILTPNYPNVMWKVADFKLWHSHSLSFCVWKNGIWAVNSKSPPKIFMQRFRSFYRSYQYLSQPNPRFSNTISKHQMVLPYHWIWRQSFFEFQGIIRLLFLLQILHTCWPQWLSLLDHARRDLRKSNFGVTSWKE